MINIDELTIGQARELARLLATPAQNGTHPAVGKYCVIRSYAAGVHIGIVASVSDSASGREVRLTDTRRVWNWTGALSCTEISQGGIAGGKLSIVAPENFVNQTIEILPTSQEAEICLRKFK